MKVSVVIPCYNDGRFLHESIGSVISDPYKDLEIIIVNDGSTNEETLTILNQYKKDGYNVLSHPNKGVTYTRNAGVKAAKGEYILPLDADNRIKPGYLSKATQFLDKGTFDIVYAKPSFFGEDIPERRFHVHDFDGSQLFLGNYIDNCAVYRRSVWEQIGGYDEQMPYQGNEDWEFWLHSYLSGFRFKFIDKELFEYRISSNSLVASVTRKRTEAILNYMMIKHIDQYREQLHQLNIYKMHYMNDQQNYLKTGLRYFRRSVKRAIGIK